MPSTSNQEYAAQTPFNGRIAHGMLAASVVSAAVANRLPGPGAIYMQQSLNFRAPVRPGDTVHARIKVKELMHEKCRVLLETKCYVGSTLVIEGEALRKVTSRHSRMWTNVAGRRRCCLSACAYRHLGLNRRCYRVFREKRRGAKSNNDQNKKAASMAFHRCFLLLDEVLNKIE